MDHHNLLAAEFEGNRSHLRAVAYRMLGSLSEADDAVQEAWLRLSRADATEIANLGGWLTTVVSRVCLDMLRSRTARREDPLLEHPTVDIASRAAEDDPAEEVLLADSVGLAMLVVLETLTPAERLAFVLHDLFAVPFDEIAPIVGRTPAAARQLASRARRRVQGKELDEIEEHDRQHEIVDAFLAAARGGDFSALMALLDPDAVMRGDATAREMGSPELTGALEMANFFNGGASAARLVEIDGVVGGAWVMRSTPQVVFSFTVVNDMITRIDLIADPEHMARLNVVLLPPPRLR